MDSDDDHEKAVVTFTRRVEVTYSEDSTDEDILKTALMLGPLRGEVLDSEIERQN